MAEFQLGTLPGDGSAVVTSNFVGDSDNTDTYSFNLATSGNINLALTGLSSDADVKLYRDVNANGIIDDGNSSLVSFSSNGGTSDDSINIKNAELGSYIVEVNRFASNNTGYDLRLSNSVPNNLLVNEIEVGNLNSSRNFTDSVSSTDTANFYHFTATENREYAFILGGLNADADIRLIQDTNNNHIVDSNEVIGISAQGGTSTDRITSSLTAGNSYFLEVYQFSDNNGNQINYNLNMTPA